MRAEGMPGEDPGCGGKAALMLSLVAVAVLVALMAAATRHHPGHGPWPDPTLTPPAVGASR